MTLSTAASSVSYNGNGSTVAWSYAFLIPSTTYVVVTVTDTTVLPNTVTTIAANLYSISGIGATTGGSVTYPLSGSPLAAGQYITIQRIVPLVQPTSLTNQGNLYPAVIEGALDYLTMEAQQTNASLAQAVMAPLGTSPVNYLTTIQALTTTCINEANLAAGYAALASTQAASIGAYFVGGHLVSTALPSLNSTQIGIVTSTQMGALSSTQLNGISGAGLTNLTTTQIPGLSTLVLTSTQLSAITTTEIPWAATTTQLNNLTTTQIGQLTTTQITGFATYQVTTTQLPTLTTTQVGAVSTTQVTGLSAITITSGQTLTTTQVGAVSTTQVTGLSAITITSGQTLTTTQVGAVSTTQVTGLSAITITSGQILTTTQVGSLTTTQVAGLSSVALSSTQFSSLTTTSLMAMTTTAIGAFSNTQLATLTSTAVAGISTTALQSLPSGSIPGSAVNGGTALDIPVRQTVLSGVNASGAPSALSAGSGLAVNLAATASAFTVTFANGFGANGAIDTVGRITVDTAGFWSGLPANNVSYLNVTYNAGSLTAGSTLAPPQYSYTYNQGAQSLLHFDGTAGSTSFLDDFGNTWAASGSAKLQTNQAKFGTAGLGGGGTSNAMGAGDYIQSTAITSSTFNRAKWSMRFWYYPNAYGAQRNIVVFYNGSGSDDYPLIVTCSSAGHIGLGLSSTGSTWDLSAPSTNFGTASPAAGSWHQVVVTFDGTAYRTFIDGVSDLVVTTATLIAPFTSVCIGAGPIGASTAYANGYIDEFDMLPYVIDPSTTTFTVPSSASSVATAGYASDWFDLLNMQMKTPSAASSAAGSNPTFTAVNRCYVGEVTTGASTVSSVLTYAYQGKYNSSWFAVAASTAYTKSHNIGVPPEQTNIMVNQSTTGVQGSGSPAADGTNGGSYGWLPTSGVSTRNTVALTTLANPINATTGATSGYYDVNITRNW